ncbi:MAG: hypothetical protein LBQ33_05745 [Oscillospiraceae bacterium]|nr:hypothetical protein [Oscillospiraceae bacterium]
MKHRNGGFLFVLLLVLLAAVILFGFTVLQRRFGDADPGGAQSRTQTVASTRAVALPSPLKLSDGFGYYYSKLSDQEKLVYDVLLAALPAFPKSIEIPPMENLALSEVFQALLRDNPLLFQLSAESRTRQSGAKTEFIPEYRMDQTEYNLRLAELAEICKAILAAVPEQASSVEKELLLHDSLLAGCDYSYTGNPEESTVYGALAEGKAACEGYAKAMILLLGLAGIDSYMQTGDATNSAGKTESHAWNKVLIDGAWYHLDATWNDPVGSGNENGGVTHSFFNLTDGEIRPSHEIIDGDNPCFATQSNYFRYYGLYFTQLDRAAETTIAQKLAAAADAGQTQIEFRLADQPAFEDAKKQLFQKQRIYRILSNADLASAAKISSQTVGYSEHAALYVLRLLPEIK